MPINCGTEQRLPPPQLCVTEVGIMSLWSNSLKGSKGRQDTRETPFSVSNELHRNSNHLWKLQAATSSWLKAPFLWQQAAFSTAFSPHPSPREGESKMHAEKPAEFLQADNQCSNSLYWQCKLFQPFVKAMVKCKAVQASAESLYIYFVLFIKKCHNPHGLKRWVKQQSHTTAAITNICLPRSEAARGEAPSHTAKLKKADIKGKRKLKS